MATRCNVHIISPNGHDLWLYRHYDGYAASTGVNIAQILKRLAGKGDEIPFFLATSLLAERGPDYGDGNARSIVYEETACEHGDIEWCYTVRMFLGEPCIEVRERRLGIWHNLAPMNLRTFRTYCAKELLAMRKRIQEYNRRRRA